VGHKVLTRDLNLLLVLCFYFCSFVGMCVFVCVCVYVCVCVCVLMHPFFFMCFLRSSDKPCISVWRKKVVMSLSRQPVI
jgi:hypothetical protein